MGCFQEIVNDYKSYIEGGDDAVLRSAFDSYKDEGTKKVHVGSLIEAVKKDFGIDITVKIQRFSTLWIRPNFRLPSMSSRICLCDGNLLDINFWMSLGWEVG